VTDAVKSRPYRSKLRSERARRTRQAVLEAARRLFVGQGYVATTIGEIATLAGVAVDTVYASVGTKPEIFRLLWETAISGTDEVVAAEDRDYVTRVHGARTARQKLTIYAGAVAAIQQRMGPLHIVLRDAAGSSPELRAIRDGISARRAVNMRALADELVAAGRTRPGLTAQQIADIIWATSSADLHHLLVHERGWTEPAYELWLRDTWMRTLLSAR
jgi:AcrR family transcriptional regulator